MVERLLSLTGGLYVRVGWFHIGWFHCREQVPLLRGVVGLGAAFWALVVSSAVFFNGGFCDSLAADFLAHWLVCLSIGSACG